MTKPSVEKGGEVKVLYVLKRNAKPTKNALEQAKLLNKNFRMAPPDPNVARPNLEDCIAIPVVKEFDGSVQGSWNVFVQSSGVQICPYSTSVLGSGRQVSGTSNIGDEDLTLVQQAILEAILSFSSTTQTSQHDLRKRIRSLEPTVCPKKLEIFGDDRTLVIPPHAFQGDGFEFMICADNERDLIPSRMKSLWKHLAEAHQSPRVARRGTVDKESSIRHSGHRLLWPFSGIPDETGPGSPGWIRVTEQGIKQSLDMTRVMFSRGNISEKIRFGKVVKEGDKVLDMYSGIGYYTLPALIHGRASYVYACEWNEHAIRALRYNIQDNHVEDRVTVLIGDCRVSAEEHNLVDMFDRVSLGLLPSSEGGWKTAVRALKRSTGGWLHVHANVPEKEIRIWTFWLCRSLLYLVQEEQISDEWVVLCDHVERVKSFAPTVSHYVADVFVGPASGFPRNTGPLGSTKAGIFEAGELLPCPNDVQVPSCALSPDGVLCQEWMR